MPFICPSKTHRECYFEMIVSAHVERIAQQNNLNASFTSSQSHYAINPYGLGTALFPPESLDEHIQYLEKFKDLILSQHNELQDVIKQRLKLIKDIQNIGAGLLEVMEDLDNAPIVHGTLTLKRNENTKKEITPEISYADLPVTETLKGRQKMIERLSLEIEKSLPVNGKINMSNQPHEVSSTVLGRFLFKNDSKDSGNIRIVYADGSEAKPFPLRMLVEPTEQTTPELFVLSTALMSMRHLELDSIVDWAWYRNKEVSQTRPLAESDEFCFQYSIKQIEELYKAYEGKPVLLKMYHTGFEPAVIGFYRALVLELSSFHRRGWLQVNPYYYRGATNFQPDEVIWQ
ncbi:MAG: hypothetical protein LBJ67_04970 [Planctomycetaceae bacterium]|nr:hypothetical protein [Planctomycetaceae bacterium]